MDHPKDPNVKPALTQFAQGDAGEGEDLKQRIIICLKGRIPDLKGIQITVFGNTVALRGEGRTLQEKRLCVECCRQVPGVMRVLDDLTVAEQTPISFDPAEE